MCNAKHPSTHYFWTFRIFIFFVFCFWMIHMISCESVCKFFFLGLMKVVSNNINPWVSVCVCGCLTFEKKEKKFKIWKTIPKSNQLAAAASYPGLSFFYFLIINYRNGHGINENKKNFFFLATRTAQISTVVFVSGVCFVLFSNAFFKRWKTHTHTEIERENWESNSKSQIFCVCVCDVFRIIIIIIIRGRHDDDDDD